MRSCAVAGAAARRVKQRNVVAWLRLVNDPIKLPVFRDRLEILPELGVVLEPVHQVIEARYGDDGNAVARLDFPDRRQISLTPLHPVERNDHPAATAPRPPMMSNDSSTAVPAVNTSSTISTRPASGAPTSPPPSPWCFASLRLKAKGTSRPSRARAIAAPAARTMPL